MESTLNYSRIPNHTDRQHLCHRQHDHHMIVNIVIMTNPARTTANMPLEVVYVPISARGGHLLAHLLRKRPIRKRRAHVPAHGIPGFGRFSVRLSRTLLSTCSLHCSSFFGLPFRILNIELVKPKKGTTMETIGNPGSHNRTRHPEPPHTLINPRGTLRP